MATGCVDRPPRIRSGTTMRGRRRVKRWVIVTHRWLSPILGVALLLQVSSGCILLFAPELFKANHSDLFQVTSGSKMITAAEALRITTALHPELKVTTAALNDGVYRVFSGSGRGAATMAFVDPGSGRINGIANPYRGFMGWLENLHLHGLSDPDLPGYLPFLGTQISPNLTIGVFLLGLAALTLVWLCISGFLIWWPSTKRFARGVTIFLRRGRYRLGRDLHKVLGLLAIPFLLMWSITGAGFEFDWIGSVWYAVTGGSTPVEEHTVFASVPADGPDIGLAAAVRTASPLVPGGTPNYFKEPARDSPTDYYLIGYTTNLDPAKHGGTHAFSKVDIAIDRHTGRAAATYGTPTWSTSQKLWRQWSFAAHFGYAVSWPWRLVWLCFGITPLVLAVTGFWTWAYRRRVRRKKASMATTR